MADVQIAVIDQQNTQIALAAPSETEVTVAVPGVQGPVGEGVPAGGTANQVLFKQSGTDYDTAWSSVTSAMIGDLEIVNADVAANAEIAVSKLADGAARQLLQTDAAGTGVEWTSNVDVPGTLDVTGAATFDSTVTVGGNNVITAGDTGTVTSTMILDGTIVNGDVNASAAIAGTKISPDFGAQNITTTGTSTAASFIPTSSTIPTNGVYLPSANNVAISTNGTQRINIDSSGRIGFGVPTMAGGVSDVTIIRNSALRWADTDGTQRADIYGDSSSNIVFRNGTGSTERMRLDSSGRLGLGSSSPDANSQLHIVGSSYQPLYVNTTSVGGGGATFFRSGTQALYIGTAGSTWLSGSSTADGLIRAEANLVLATNGNTRAITIDSLQRVGVGTATPSFDFQVDKDVNSVATSYTRSSNAGSSAGGRVTAASNVGSLNMSAYSSTHSTWANTCTISSESTFTGGLVVNAGGSNPLRFWTNSTEQARIDSSGRLLVGTSTDIGNSSKVQIRDGNLNIYHADSAINAGYGIHFSTDGGATARPKARISVAQTLGNGGNLLLSTTADGASSPTERMRISANGQIKATCDGGLFAYRPTADTTSVLIGGYSNVTGTEVAQFFVRTNGNVESRTNSYGAISDAKIKENVLDASSQWEDIKNVRVRKYNLIGDDASTHIGVIAQELEQTSPGLINESIDHDEDGVDLGTVTKSVKYSVLYMKAVKALQEAMDRIETLEAKVAALEAQ